ncbi:gp36 [Bacillus phage G]|uniref:Gp36 n=1 Tax=Bacillus phage G TaxID=2884420 RepID=G3MBA6_9CAUD|nr:gp36 [Bacillus phage G]AEO93307.1 gp36 [Bacillus phage G]
MDRVSLNVEKQIHSMLRQYYVYDTIKVPANMNTVTVKRKEKLNVRKKILSIIPIYDYKEWEEELSDWEIYDILTIFDKTISVSVCIDCIGEKVYWKYLVEEK